MRRALSILCLLAAPALVLALPPQAFDDAWAAAGASAGGGGYSDDVTAISSLKHYWTVLDTSSVTLDGTNVASWTASVGGNVAAPTNAAQRPFWDSADYGNRGGLGFGGGQAMSLSASIPSTNVLIVAVGFRATQTTLLTFLARHDSTGGPALALWSDSTAYFHPDANDMGVSSSAAGFSNRLVYAAAHFGGNVTTNNAVLWKNGTRMVPISSYSQAAPGPSFTRIGARQADGWTVGRINAIAVFYPVADTNEAQSIIATMQGVYPL